MTQESSVSRSSSGFTLVEMMVVIAIIAAIVVLVGPTLMRGKDRANVMQCKHNLREISNSILLFKDVQGYFPKDSGIRFFLRPWNKETIENDPKYAKIYVCPGDENLLQAIEGDFGILKDELDDWDHFTSDFTSYSGRNQKDYPMDFNKKASQLIVSDDDEGGLNHPNQINALYLDGSIEEVQLNEILGDDEDFYVGEDSSIEKFQVLSND